MPVEKPVAALMFAALYGLSLVVAESSELWLVALTVPLIWLSVTDFCDQIIPDTATAAVAVWGVARNGWSELQVVDLFVAVAVLATLWATSEAFWRRQDREILGLGDVKLIAAGVLCAGTAHIWLAVLIASLAGIATVLISRVRDKDDEPGVPFGPFIAYGLFLAALPSGNG